LVAKHEFEAIEEKLRNELLGVEGCGEKRQQTELEAFEHMPLKMKHN